MNAHLTDQQLYELLSPEPSAVANIASRTHLVACPMCRGEFATLRDSLENFRLAATNISEHQTPPRPVVGASVRTSFLTLPHVVWATGLASVLAISAATFSNLHKPNAPSPHAVTAPAHQPVSDEALLQDIDTDLSTPVPPSLQPLDMTVTGEPTSTSTSN